MMVLLPIKKKYCDLILGGSKRFEFRKSIPKGLHGGDEVAIYCTRPTSAIVACFTVDYVITDKPWNVYWLTKIAGGLSAEEFLRYFNGARLAHAIRIETLRELAEPLPLTELRGSATAPQSFVYLKEREAEIIRDTSYPVEIITNARKEQ